MLAALPPVDVTAAQARSAADSVLIEILRATNQQLSLWTNPYGLMVAALGMLFAAMAIVAGVILFRQSSEHKRQIEAFVSDYRGILDGMRQQVAVQVENTIAELKLKAETAEGENKARLEALVASLQTRKDAAAVAFPAFSTVSFPELRAMVDILASMGVRYRCTEPECGHEWTGPTPGLLGLVQCPTCKATVDAANARIDRS